MSEINVVFLNTDNIVVQITVFDAMPDDMSIFLSLQTASTGISDLTYVEGSLYGGHPGIGNELYNASYFRELSPYPSWIWDASAMEWMAPVLKPTIGAPVGQVPPEFVYDWNETEGSWDKRLL